MSTKRESRPQAPVASIERELVGHEVLVIDADEKVQRGLVHLLAPAGLHVTGLADGARAVELLGQKFFGVVIVDLDTPAPGEGLKLVRKIQEASPHSQVLFLTPRKSFDAAVAAFRAGAHDVVLKAPDQVEYLKERVLAAAGQAARRGQTDELLEDVRTAMDEFLKRFMEAERRALDAEDRLAGRDPSRTDVGDEIRLLVVDADDRLFQALERNAGQRGFSFVLAHTGGEAFDRVSSSRFHIALVAETLPDLPGSMVVSGLKTQAPDLIAIRYALGGRLEIVETTRTIPIVEKFTAATQLTERLGELAEALRAKGRERRYLQAFREKHYDFLRRFAELRKKLER